MSFPNLPDKHAAQSLLNAEDIVFYRTRLSRKPDLHAPQGGLFCLERGLPPGRTVDADAALTRDLVAAIQERGAHCTSGTTWTTDAPYRETLAEVQQYQQEGIKTVEMESSGLFAVGQVRAVQTTSVVVVMDSLATFEWKVPERLDSIQRSLEIVYRAALDVLGK